MTASHVTHRQHKTPQRVKVQNIVLWITQVLAGAVFLVAGAAKLYAVPAMVAIFDRLGLGEWLLHVTGAIEFGSAVLLFMPTFATVGAVLLACTTIGAIAVHFAVIGGSPVPAIILLGCCLFIAWGRRGELSYWRRPGRAH
jgi:uncharacterized membrane protein YphA (DoxX/SURF4 family)